MIANAKYKKRKIMNLYMVEVWKPKMGNHFYRLVKADSVEQATKKAEKAFKGLTVHVHETIE